MYHSENLHSLLNEVDIDETGSYYSNLRLDIEDYEKDEYLNAAPESAKIPSYINTTDYTLNSPLIADAQEKFIHYLKGGEVNQLFQTKDWERNKNWLLTVRKDWSGIRTPRLLHNQLSKIWQDNDIATTSIEKLINETDNYAKQTHTVIQTYLKEWIKKDIPFNTRAQCHKETLKYGSHMLEGLRLTWVMNASTDFEMKSLQSLLKLVYINKSDFRQGIKYSSPILGEVFLGSNILYIPNINMLWDRNMMLLYKDTATARFHTLFSMEHRQFFKYKQTNYHDQVELYKLGDQVVGHDPNSGYETIGMLEPITSLRLSEIAGSYRPLIPLFPHFRGHITKKIEELSRINPHSEPFYQFIDKITDKDMLLTMYGSFRHWGHPFIDYIEGLKALHKNVTSNDKPIDIEYANLLASDLTFKILKREYLSKYKWFLDANLLPDKHPLKEHVINNTWPAIDVIMDLPPTWHELPILPTWEIPEVVDPTLIYSDKTHSIQRSELIKHLTEKPNKPIPTRKVLNTLLKTASTNWPEFLKQINDHGLGIDDLIIGLKAKEREIKWKGRFFALMSWKLREYFVFTEYLIKTKIIPLFKGLTMADDQTTLIKKMLNNTAGQGSLDYSNITIANHIDYEKWNNYQRYESTEPVFTVMGKFFGLPKLFSRTHEFFEKSLIYYRDRPDLMTVKNGEVHNVDPDQRVCWQGQKGGLEGLRQKGWSVLNLLCIERESRVRNTEVRILVQGDNQVICTLYKLNNIDTKLSTCQSIGEVLDNNSVIMNAIRKATGRIGLIINEDETLQTTDMLIYGKVVVYRGNVTSLDEKRYSRITCTTNDQLPSLSNILATVSTNCLTVSHFSKSPLNPMINYNWLGNFVLSILSMHNPALRCSPQNVVSSSKHFKSKNFRITALYLDPSIGGISGMSLTRFHLRMFPDPATESLSFWKIISESDADLDLCSLSLSLGNPKVLNYDVKHFSKLLEDPASLNLPKGLSSQNLIKSEIKKALYRDQEEIKHDIIKETIKYVDMSEDSFISFLESVTPCFPRFLSEFRSASYFGLADGIFGLFENSKTIRNVFKSKFKAEVDEDQKKFVLEVVKTGKILLVI